MDITELVEAVGLGKTIDYVEAIRGKQDIKNYLGWDENKPRHEEYDMEWNTLNDPYMRLSLNGPTVHHAGVQDRGYSFEVDDKDPFVTYFLHILYNREIA